MSERVQLSGGTADGEIVDVAPGTNEIAMVHQGQFRPLLRDAKARAQAVYRDVYRRTGPGSPLFVYHHTEQ